MVWYVNKIITSKSSVIGKNESYCNLGYHPKREIFALIRQSTLVSLGKGSSLLGFRHRDYPVNDLTFQ